MGITGLLPFLEKASKQAHIAEFRGCTAAVDAYCWLHKGAYGCAEKLIMEEETDGYIQYCMKYIKMLQSYDIRPILVFDGQHLPAKKLTEQKRREQRDVSKKKAREFLRIGKIDVARNYIRQSIDITHKMALALIKECRRNGIDCIVAPYEADAQLAYLNIKKMVHVVITEDSDLILFGCDKIFFKLNLQGFGTLVDSEKLHIPMNLRPDRYTFEKFRHMCILSGCDYLENLPGVGLKKALKFISLTANPNIYDVLMKLPSYLKLTNIVITNEYREAFMVADATFKHQLVFDPIQRKLVPLSDPESCGTNVEYCKNAGANLDNKLAFQLALGNIDPFTHKVMDNWSPDSGNTNLPAASIWCSSYQKPGAVVKKLPKQNAPNTNVVTVTVGLTKEEEEEYDLKLQHELDRYKVVEQTVKKPKVEEEEEEEEERPSSPLLSKRPVIPFKKLSKLSKFQRTEVDTSSVLKSRFFSSKSTDDSVPTTVDQCTKETLELKENGKENGTGNQDSEEESYIKKISVCRKTVIKSRTFPFEITKMENTDSNNLDTLLGSIDQYAKERTKLKLSTKGNTIHTETDLDKKSSQPESSGGYRKSVIKSFSFKCKKLERQVDKNETRSKSLGDTDEPEFDLSGKENIDFESDPPQESNVVHATSDSNKRKCMSPISQTNGSVQSDDESEIQSLESVHINDSNLDETDVKVDRHVSGIENNDSDDPIYIESTAPAVATLSAQKVQPPPKKNITESRTKMTPVRYLGLPPGKKKNPPKNQLKLTTLFENMKKK